MSNGDFPTPGHGPTDDSAKAESRGGGQPEDPDMIQLQAQGMPEGTLRRAAKMTRSGLRRYPKQLIDSIRERGALCHLPAESCAFDPDRFMSSGLGAVWLGHATVLLRVGGMNIITDPVFSQRVGWSVGGYCFGVSRLATVAMCLDRLPPIDLVLLSHAHFDHLDRPSLRRLASKATKVVTARSTRKMVPPGFGEVIELDWSRSVTLGGGGEGGAIQLSSVEPAHWGARAALDRHRRYNSYLIDTRPSNGECSRRVLFGGDTAMTDAFNGLGPVDLAIFGIGAYEPWSHHHANPEQVWAMFHAMGGVDGGGRLLPMHHSMFLLGRYIIRGRTLEVALPGPYRLLSHSRSQVFIVCDDCPGVWVWIEPNIARLDVVDEYIVGETDIVYSLTTSGSDAGFFILDTETNYVLQGLSRDKWEQELAARGITGVKLCSPFRLEE